MESDADDGGPDAGQTDDDSPAAAQTAPEANDDDSEPLASPPHALDHPADAASPQSSPTSKRALTVKQQLLAACHAAEHWLQAERDRPGETRPDEILRVLRAAIERAEGRPRKVRQQREQGRPRQPRQGSKEAQVITMLRRPEGATLAQIIDATGWQQHTVRGFFAGALKKRRGLQVISQKQPEGVRTYHVAD